MLFDVKELEKKLAASLALYDKKNAETLCEEFVKFLYTSSEPISSKSAENILLGLRNKRMFDLMRKVSDALIQTSRHTYKIRRQYAQALIEMRDYPAALFVLNELKNDTGNDTSSAALVEYKESVGLIGRVYKQLFVNDPQNAHSAEQLNSALQSYFAVYSIKPEENLWPGINVVALLNRAKTDQVEVSGFPEAHTLAEEILSVIENKDSVKEANTWDFATAVEASVALNRPDEAITWMEKYVNAPYTDAFEIASTVRQLTEVWRLDMSSEVGKQVLPILRAALLKREGGNILIDTTDLRKQKENAESLSKKLEGVLGYDTYQTYHWYMNGAKRCLPVARIGRESSIGFGTGFLLKGSDIHESLKDEVVLLTNAHVISNDPGEKKALRPDEVIITFELLDWREEFIAGNIFFTSPSAELDVTIIRFEQKSLEKLKSLFEEYKLELYRLAKRLPESDGTKRVYIIGHPRGGALQLSLQDNVLLNYQDPHLHYRTPTTGGSSGSPVFDDQWDLIGIHHAEVEVPSDATERKEKYNANEGVWIDAIRNAINIKMGKKENAG